MYCPLAGYLLAQLLFLLVHRDTAFWYTVIARRRWAYFLEPDYKGELSLRVSLPVPMITSQILLVVTFLDVCCTGEEFPSTRCLLVGLSSLNTVANICSALFEGLKKCPNCSPCSRRQKFLFKNKQITFRHQYISAGAIQACCMCEGSRLHLVGNNC